MKGENPNWTKVLGSVATVINSQHGRGKDDISAFEAVYGQVSDHEFSCSKEKACSCWTLSDCLNVTHDPQFEEYVRENYYLADDDNDGYF